MSMDERQQQIREGAGLDESRLNQEFIDFLNRWSLPALIVIAVIVGGYALYTRSKQSNIAQINRAFVEYEAIRTGGNPSPESLVRVADEFSGVSGLAVIARLEAADAYARAWFTGLRPGTALAATPDPADVLSPDDRSWNLGRAGELYQRVYESTRANPAMRVHMIGALFGMAAVAESKNEVDKAKAHYQEIITAGKGNMFDIHATIAKSRMDSIGRLAELPHLFKESELPPLPGSAGALPGLDATIPGLGASPAPGTPAPGTPETPAPASPDSPLTTPPENAPPGGQPGAPAPETPTQSPGPGTPPAAPSPGSPAPAPGQPGQPPK